MLDASNDDLSLLGHHQMCQLVSWWCYEDLSLFQVNCDHARTWLSILTCSGEEIASAGGCVDSAAGCGGFRRRKLCRLGSRRRRLPTQEAVSTRQPAAAASDAGSCVDSAAEAAPMSTRHLH